MVNTMTNEFAAKVAEEIEKAKGWKCEVKELRKNGNVNFSVFTKFCKIILTDKER